MAHNALVNDAPEPFLHRLFIADPQTAESVKKRLLSKKAVVDPGRLSLMEEAIILGLAQETALGEALADGFVQLAGEVTGDVLERYARQVALAVGDGPALGAIMAAHLPRILKTGEAVLLERFLQTVAALRKHGTYTLTSPLAILKEVLDRHGADTAGAYLSLLLAAFGRELAYDLCKLLVHLLPRAVAGFSPERIQFQIQALRRVVAFDATLTAPFLDGMAAGLALLKRQALHRFVTLGVERARVSLSEGSRFLSLQSQSGLEAWRELRVGVALREVAAGLGRYLRARTGKAVAVKALSEESVPGDPAGPAPEVLCDGRAVFLPDEMEVCRSREENIRRYKLLVKLEAGVMEFGSFDFDLDRFRHLLEEKKEIASRMPAPVSATLEACDLTCFLNSFPRPDLAGDLFTLFEHQRLRCLTDERYPGLRSRLAGALAEALNAPAQPGDPGTFWVRLYRTIALGLGDPFPDRPCKALLHAVKVQSTALLALHPTVEASAVMTALWYERVMDVLEKEARDAGLPAIPRLYPPFGRRIRPELFYRTHEGWERLALRIKKRLAEMRIPVHRVDVRKALEETNGSLDRETLTRLVEKAKAEGDGAAGTPAVTDLDPAALLGAEAGLAAESDAHEGPGEVFWYHEWDAGMQDYLHRHARVLDRRQAEGDGDFYRRVLAGRSGLVGRIRCAFELMRPEGLVVLRPWMEGDAFDYRCLVDAAIDRKIGRLPSERLYIHRIKQQRDVAVLLLVDLSRSTANAAAGSEQTVLDVEKEAIVLFCEALSVLGDRFAVAGFSGSGRLVVDYFRVKDFDEPLDDAVRKRIGGLYPRRSTRMGAAIRHAAFHLSRAASRVRLLMVLGDGFPNDTEYKKDQAVWDTRMAVSEVRAKGMHTHAITVNMAADPQLDDLYGRMHHTVISDVRDLPEKLHRIYSRLTR